MLEKEPAMLLTSQIENWAKYALDCCGRPELFSILEFNYRHNMTKNLGTAVYSSNYGKPKGVISLSKEWFNILPEFEKINTVIHEVCHIITDAELSRPNKLNASGWAYAIRENRLTKGHGSVWAGYMDKCGLPPTSCYRGGLNAATYINGYCACKTWRLTKQRAGRIRNCTNSYFCPKCKETITLVKDSLNEICSK